MAVSEFTLGVGPSAQNRPSQIINDFSAWNLANNLDEGCSLQFSSRGRSLGAALIEELDTDVFIYQDGVLFQRFRIVNLNQRWDSDGEDIIEVAAICYRRLLKSRHVITPLAFDNEGQGDIIWGLIDHTQSQPNGDLGITIGSLDNTVLRNRTYTVGDNIFDMISDFTRVQNGIAWDITPNLELVVKPIFDFPLRTTPIELGSTARSLQRPSNAENFANVSIVSGDGEATVPVVIGTPGLIFDSRGRWEKVTSLPGEQFQDALDERAFGTLDTALSPPSNWTSEIVPFRYFSDLDLDIGELVALVEPPTIAYRRGPADAVLLQVIDRNISQTAEGDFQIVVSGVEITPPNIVLTLAAARLSALGAVPQQKAAGGDVSTDGQFIYHVFTTSDFFIPLPEFGTLNVEYIIVGGGGGGGGGVGTAPGGGGGGGEIVTNVGSPLAVATSTFVTVGSGGFQNLNGSSSFFGAIEAIGGGAGGTSLAAPLTGASGGGASTQNFTTGAIGTAGNNGGSYIGTTGEAGGAGGGGAGSAGSDTDDIVSIDKIGGTGGSGASDTFLNVPTLRAGGGGGGFYFDPPFIIQPIVRVGAAGGSGGGGRGGGANGGADVRNGGDGINGTGGGGGGGSYEIVGTTPLIGDGGIGGSGIVIVRYLA